MFDFKHYIPILRWKEAEKESLRFLSADKKNVITPLIEVVFPNPKTYRGKIVKSSEEQLSDKLNKLHVDLYESWGTEPLMIDLNLLPLNFQMGGYNNLVDLGCDFLGLNIIPVVYLTTNSTSLQAIKLIIQKGNNGICLRLFGQDLNSDLENQIAHILQKLEISIENINLLVDFKVIDINSSEEIKTKMDIIPYLDRWSTFTIAAGSFYEDLHKFDPGKNEIFRFDWQTWKYLINDIKLIRRPSFSDYTIQYPFNKELEGIPNPSASIRYTLPDKWIIWRGRSLRTFGSEQYIANAYFLNNMPEFYGKDFSYGDKYIEEQGLKQMNGDMKGPGNPETWLLAGINHHMSLVAHQINSLPYS